MATYEFVCDEPECDKGLAREGGPLKVEHSFPMSANESTKTTTCGRCGTTMRKLITGGTATLFKGAGWTPNFSKHTASPYDPEKDMESVDRQRKETGMDESEWKPKKAVYGDKRVQGVDIPTPTKTTVKTAGPK